MLIQTLEAVKAIPFGGFKAFRAKAPPEMVEAIDVAKSRTEEIVNEVMQELKNVLGPEIGGRITGALTYSVAVSYALGLLTAPITVGASLALSTTKWLRDPTAMITKALNGRSGLKNGVTVMHTMRGHTQYKTGGTGHLYQGRFKSFPIQTDGHLLTVMRYVERKPVRASLIELAEKWRSCMNKVETEAELNSLRHSFKRGLPFGDEN